MNQVILIGTFTNEFMYSHTTRTKEFYISYLRVKRISGIEDTIPIILEKHMSHIDISSKYYIEGDLRVINRRNRSLCYVFPNLIYSIDEPDTNKIALSGSIHLDSGVRTTPNGKIIRNIMLDVEGNRGQIYSIPVLFWNSLANSELPENLTIEGRIQSRIYVKELYEREVVEISANKII